MNQEDTVITTLTQLGFFKYVPAAELAHVQASVRQSYHLFRNLHDIESYHDGSDPRHRRCYHADAEELAEQGIGTFLRGLEPLFRSQGILITTIEDIPQWNDQGEYCYDVIINGSRYPIINMLEQLQQASWQRAHQRTIEIINHLLGSASSSERAYAQAASNDAGIAILTKELYTYISTLPLDRLWKPYPIEEIARVYTSLR